GRRKRSRTGSNRRRNSLSLRRRDGDREGVGGKRVMTRPLWTAEEIAVATGGRIEGAGFAATGINFDSREIQPGDLFVALRGEARDGHDFAPMAFERGAAAVLGERPVEGGPVVVVPDSLKALEALGAAARDRAPQIRRGAVTGSVGKTSVTQAIRAGLDLAGPAHGSV